MSLGEVRQIAEVELLGAGYGDLQGGTARSEEARSPPSSIDRSPTIDPGPSSASRSSSTSTRTTPSSNRKVTQGAVATPPGAPAVIFSSGVALIPVSVGIAILRHGLYDVDLVLNRTIVFASLAAFITGVYAATVVGIGSVIGDASNLALTLGATALVAVIFEPVRVRVQHWSNRAVDGHRATPYEVLTAIVDDLVTGTTSRDQLEGLATLLANETGASHATIWVEVGGALRAAAWTPTHDPAEHDRVRLELTEGDTAAGGHPCGTGPGRRRSARRRVLRARSRRSGDPHERALLRDGGWNATCTTARSNSLSR